MVPDQKSDHRLMYHIFLQYCKPINIGGYLIWQILPSGYIDSYLNWLSLLMSSINLIKAICIGGYLIWQFLGPSQIHQLKSPPNIVLTVFGDKLSWATVW